MRRICNFIHSMQVSICEGFECTRIIVLRIMKRFIHFHGCENAERDLRPAFLQPTSFTTQHYSKLALFFLTGTSERVCLITGGVDPVSRILDFVMEKIREKPDPNAKTAMDFDNKVSLVM